MDVYFVRHGQTNGNAKHRHQPPEIPLNNRGRRQAAVVGTMLKGLYPTYIIASPLVRARETASIISQHFSRDVSELPALSELLRPPYLYGQHHFSLGSILYMFRWLYVRDERYWERVGGESYPQIIARVERARQQLEEYDADATLIVVSHSVFINFFIEHVCYHRDISLFRAVLLVFKIRSIKNSGIIHLRYDPHVKQGELAWKFVAIEEGAYEA